MTALRSLGHSPAVIRLDEGGDLRARIVASGTVPVLAGPLGTVARRCIGLPNRVVGLSWGYDLHELLDDGDLAWIAQLDGLIVDSTATGEIARAAGLAAERITFLPWGIDLGVFTKSGPRTQPVELGLPADTRFILSLRAHDDRYRVSDIIHAWLRLAPAHPTTALVIGHHGPATPGLRNLVSDLGVDNRVRFLGTIDEPELAPLLRAAACYITAASIDGTSVTLLQAMACRTPVVASDTPGNRGWIAERRTGRLFPVGDVPALADAIDRALREDSSSMVVAAAELVRRDADWGRNLERLDQVLFTRT